MWKRKVRKLSIWNTYISHDHELRLEDENVLASECSETDQLDKSSSTSCDSLVDIDADPSPNKVAMLAKHKALLLIRSEEKFTVLWFCSSYDDIKYYTGFQSYSPMCFFYYLQPECNFLYYVGTGNTSHGEPYETITKRGLTRSLSPMEEFFLTMVRLPGRSSREGSWRSIQYSRWTYINNCQYMFLCENEMSANLALKGTCEFNHAPCL